jgi:N-acetylneuraminic acid mutarotase/FtsZ-binding cell division protein ZapB
MKNKTAITLTTILVISTVFASTSLIMSSFAESMPSPSWRTKAAMPTARGQAAVITGDNGLVYVMGGYAGVAEFATVEAYNPLTDTWTAKAGMPQATRGPAFAKGLDGIIYVISGWSGIYLTKVQAYNETLNTWSTKNDIPVAVWMASATTGDDGKIYVFGGEPSGSGEINATQIYDPSADSWTTGADMPTARRQLGVVRATDGQIYAFGGYNGSALSVVEAYNPSTNTWTTKASMPTPKLEFGATLGPDGKIYIIGGGTDYGNDSPPFFDTVEIYDPKTDTWTIPSWSESAMPTARKELGATIGKNGRIYAISGANGGYIATNEEASIMLPDNVPPTAYIDSISPTPATRGQAISFSGHGSDSDGSIVAYKWTSSLNGTISTSASFSVSTLAVGTHTIYFSAQDNSGAWSSDTVAIVTVNVPITEDPTYQQLQNVNQSLTQDISDLKTQADNLAQQNSNLAEQNANLTDQVNSLTQKLDTTTMMLLGTSIFIIVLVVVTIALIFMRKPKAVA